MNGHPKHLRLLAVLEALLTERHVTRAAQRLNLSQPATSAALAQLRSLFGDPLLVRSGHELVLTPRASELLPEVSAALAATERVFAAPGRLNPAALHKRFHIAVSDAAGQVLMPAVVSRLAEQAPGVVLRLSAAPPELPESALADGSLDLVVAHHERAAPSLRSMTLARHPLVAVLREGHPLVRNSLTIDQLVRCPHVAIFPHAASIEEVLRGAFNAADRPFRLLAAVQQLSVAAGIVARTDAIALLSAPAAELYRRSFGLQVLALPAALELAPVPVRAFWHERNQHDAASAWLRQTIRQCVGSDPQATRGTGE